MSFTVDCFNLIFDSFDGHKEMLNFLSINKEWNQFKKNIKFHKKFIPYNPSMKKLHYFENIKCSVVIHDKSQLKNLPKNVTWIMYNAPNPLDVGDIHNQVQYIQFGGGFNHKLQPGVIPEGVTHIVFGFVYNQPLEKGVIPSTTKNIKFVFRFDQKLKVGDIPDGVTHLTMSHVYNHTFEKGVLPESLVHLDVSRFFERNKNKGIIPSSVKSGTILSYL